MNTMKNSANSKIGRGKSCKIVPVFIPMLGCPHQCVYCNQHEVTGRRQEAAMEEIIQQLQDGMSQIDASRPADEIAFFGGSFTCLSERDQKEILSLAAPCLERGLVKGIRLSTRPDYISDEGLELLKRYHVTTIELGIQSTDHEVLLASGRGHTPDDIFMAARLVKEHGFLLGLQMMAGLPGDTAEKCWQTALDIVRMKPDFVRIYPTLILRDSPLERMYERGAYQPLTLDEAIRQVSRLKILFEYHDIHVIRTGLQANEGLDTGTSYVAGPYHPAFGELVDNEVYYLWFLELIKEKLPSSVSDICLLVHPSRLSKALGQKKRNLERLRTGFPGLKVFIKASDRVTDNQVKCIYREEGNQFASAECLNSVLDDASRFGAVSTGKLGTMPGFAVCTMEKSDFLKSFLEKSIHIPGSI